MSRPTDPWFKFYPREWLNDTRELTLEQRGAYIDAICIQMQEGAPVKDDMSWLAHQLYVSKRKAAAIVEQLIEAQMLRRTANGLSNAKCEKVLAEREEQRKVGSEAASIREKNKREKSANQLRKTDENIASEAPISTEKTELLNEINETIAEPYHEAVHTRARLRKEDKKKEEIEERKTVGQALTIDLVAEPVEVVAPYIAGLNGSTTMIVESVARMFNELAPDLIVARKQVEGACEQYGPDNFRDGFAELSAKVADGVVKRPSYRTLCGYVQKAKERQDRRPRGVGSETSMERMARLMGTDLTEERHEH